MNRVKTLLATAAMSLVAVGAFATTMIPVNLAHLVEYTDKAFVGTVQSVEVVETSMGWGEEITVLVSDAVLGDCAKGEAVTWTQFRNAEHVRLPSMPEFTVGAECLVFLAAQAEGSPFTAPVALEQGAFVIGEDASGNLTARNARGNEHVYEGLNIGAIEAEMPETESQLDSLIGAARVLDSADDPVATYGLAEGETLTATILPSE